MDAADYRFIPARAGNTTRVPSTTHCSSVHPRSRGEHWGGSPSCGTTGGSSPLARGTLRRPPPLHPPRRFIPARAGNTSSGGTGAEDSAVHPRSRGEHPRRPVRAASLSGSSPLARGTRQRPARARRLRRFIPARAGNTVDTPAACPPSPVHPRSRGEHPCRSCIPPGAYGSSPLARGTRGSAERWPPTSRFIPARAGNTASPGPSSRGCSVHPRSRGEHQGRRLRGGRAVGSSPLARGTRPECGCSVCRVRFIPARAGNTGCCTREPRWSTVHPRSRGEHRMTIRFGLMIHGSSPLARGTLEQRVAGLLTDRFIPARAGNTLPGTC